MLRQSTTSLLMSHYHINAHIGHCSTSHSRWRLSADSQSGEMRFLILRQAADTEAVGRTPRRRIPCRTRACRTLAASVQALLGRQAAC